MSTTDTKTLRLVHVIFRHGDRTSDQRAVYPNDPHKNETYDPYGFAQLTNDGKKNIYRLGQIIRKRYKDYLNEEFSPGLVDPWSSDYDRTKASLQLFLAGLFPPKAGLIWNNELPWQPIPTNYLPCEQDELFRNVGTSSTLRNVYIEHLKTSARGKEIREKYAETFEYLTKMTGRSILCSLHVLGLHNILLTESECGLELPSWVTPTLKEKLREITELELEIQMDTNELRQGACGKLFAKFLKDTESKIAGVSACKMHIYSGHDLNIGNILIALGLMYKHLPNYGSCILLEVHDIEGECVIKVFYRESKKHAFKDMKSSNGQTDLKMVDFRAFVKELNPDTDPKLNIDE